MKHNWLFGIAIALIGALGVTGLYSVGTAIDNFKKSREQAPEFAASYVMRAGAYPNMLPAELITKAKIAPMEINMLEFEEAMNHAVIRCAVHEVVTNPVHPEEHKVACRAAGDAVEAITKSRQR